MTYCPTFFKVSSGGGRWRVGRSGIFYEILYFFNICKAQQGSLDKPVMHT